MSMNMFKPLTNVPEARYHHVRILGTGAADPTLEYGPGLDVTRTSEGLYKFSWDLDKNPGEFIGVAGYIFGDTTPGDVKGHTLTRDTFTEGSSSTRASIEVNVWDSAFSTDDLDATEYLDITFVFKASGV